MLPKSVHRVRPEVLARGQNDANDTAETDVLAMVCLASRTRISSAARQDIRLTGYVSNAVRDYPITEDFLIWRKKMALYAWHAVSL
jgi:hypothetical protein